MGRVEYRIRFANGRDAQRWLRMLADKGIDTGPISEVESVPLMEKTNGPRLAAWLGEHPGWHDILDSTGENAAKKAAYKIMSGSRRGFESKQYEARAVQHAGGWIVEARRKPERSRGRSDAPQGMRPLF